MNIYRIKKDQSIAALIDGAPEIVHMRQGQRIRGQYMRRDTINQTILISRGADLWALPEGVIELVGSHNE